MAMYSLISLPSSLSITYPWVSVLQYEMPATDFPAQEQAKIIFIDLDIFAALLRAEDLLVQYKNTVAAL